MRTTLLFLTIATILILNLFHASDRTFGSDAQTELIAFSLREAQRTAKEHPGDENLKRVGGIAEIVGFIIDNNTKDVIILGKSSDVLPSFCLDDLVFLLRCAQIGGLSGPGVSLEPKGDISSGQLQVVLFGGSDRTSIGSVSFDADYLMKKIALDLEPSGVSKLESYAERTKKKFFEEKVETWNILSRFWFTPTYAPVTTSKAEDIFLLREIKVGVLVQTLSAEINGRPAPLGFKDDPAEKYAIEFMNLYDKMAEKHREFAELARFMGGMKLMNVLLTKVQPESLDFWINRYSPTEGKIPSEVPLLRKTFMDARRQLSIIGGVRMTGLTQRLRRGEVAAIRDAILIARPSERSLTWTVVFDKDWRITIPSASKEDQEIANLFANGLIQHEKGDDAGAIQSFDQVLNTYPSVVEARFLKAVCERDLLIKKGKVDEVLGPLNSLTQLAGENPQFLEIRYELGSTLRVLGRNDQAIEELEKIISIRQDFAPAHHALGLAYWTKGDNASATKHLQEYLRIESGQNNKWVLEAKRLIEEIASGKKQTLGNTVELETFSDVKHNFQCQYPKEWKLLRENEIGKLLPSMGDAKNIVVAFVYPSKTDSNVNIQVVPIEADELSDKDITDAIPALDAAYKERFRRFQKIEAGQVNIGGVRGIRYLFTCERAGVMIEQCVITLVKSRKAYTLTFTAQEQDFANFWETCFNRTLTSFQIGGS
ncbi:MAG: tetratricopeptide repeat protein [Proteobacteria bacterium]|nr:tetratricopeptide repeat protein [Pseudomonadota bacterium]